MERWLPYFVQVVVAGLLVGGLWVVRQSDRQFTQAKFALASTALSEQLQGVTTTMKQYEERLAALPPVVSPSPVPASAAKVTTMVTAPKATVPIETKSPSTASVQSASATDSVAVSGVININTATAEQLDSLPGIGASYAQRIIDARPFTSVDDLDRVAGIGAKTIEKLRAQVTV